MIAMLAYGISPAGRGRTAAAVASSRAAGAAGKARMTASASSYSGAAAEPIVSRQPAPVRASSRTMALVLTSAPDALATARAARRARW